jgi:hypothetical protein
MGEEYPTDVAEPARHPRRPASIGVKETINVGEEWGGARGTQDQRGLIVRVRLWPPNSSQAVWLGARTRTDRRPGWKL